MALFFRSEITLPKTEYFFTERVTIWQILAKILGILLLCFDAAVVDIFTPLEKKIIYFKENWDYCVFQMFYPKLRYA